MDVGWITYGIPDLLDVSIEEVSVGWSRQHL